MKLFAIFILTFCFSFSATAQEEKKSTDKEDENFAFVDGDDKTSVFQFNTKFPIPKRAALYSALLPGLGQAYNKQYWKVGVVGAGLAAAGYFINFSSSEYKRFRAAYVNRIDNDLTNNNEFPELANYGDDDLKTLQNTNRQNLEYAVVFTTVGYAINILDAFISANLRSFDVGDDIGFYTKPTYENQQFGLALVFKIK